MYYNFTNSNSKSELLDTAYMLIQQNPANLMIFASENKTVGPCKKVLNVNIFIYWYALLVSISQAGYAGFEPANSGVKTLCLASWRIPKVPF